MRAAAAFPNGENSYAVLSWPEWLAYDALASARAFASRR